MYQEHFGLTRPPFKITPDTSLFFEGSQRGAALDALIYAIKSGEGIIKVVGEVGSGKTMLCRMLEVRLSDEIEIIYIANPSLSPDNILHVIAHELNLDVNDQVSKVSVMQQIQAYLLEKHADISNLETDENKLLQMVLFGQPELDEKLSEPHIRQLKERITHSFNLSPFPPDDTLQYLNFRLRSVGYKGPDVFNKKTAGVVKKYSDGLTRRINILADKSLLAAYSEGSHTVTPLHIKSAAQDSEFKSPLNSKKAIAIVSGIALLVVTLAVGFYLGKQNTEIGNQANDINVRQVAEEKTKIRQELVQPVAKSATNNEAERYEPTGVIKKRLDDTQQWLLEGLDSHYSIQLFMARSSDADRVEVFLQDLPETLDLTKIYIYETVINGRLWLSVLYSDFATQDDAIESLDQLPSSLKASDPYLRRVSALKKDSARNK